MKNKFSPLLFLASLGAGGISVIPFSFLNYTFPHEKNLIQMAHIPYETLEFWQWGLFRFLEATMIIFTIIHIVLSIVFAVKLIKWMKEDGYREFIENPLINSAILAPSISIIMTMNVVIGPIRYFIPSFADSLQFFMLPALIFWGIIWILIMRMEIRLLKISFEKSFDINKIHFGWLLHPFALGMLTVTGTGIAALSTNISVAHIVAFMSVISGTMGFFLLIVKMITLFKSHFAAKGMPERQFLPSFLIVIPNITLYAISIFRLGHYLERHHGAEMGPYFLIVIVLAFAFETWYLAFALSLLKDYFKKHFSKEFYVSQWGLVCPVVAYAVLGSFVYKVFVPNIMFYILILIVMFMSMILFFVLLGKQIKCEKNRDNTNLICS